LSSWTLFALVAIPLAIAAIERSLLLRFLAKVYERGGSKDLQAAASATRHLAPRPTRSQRGAITTVSGAGLPGGPDARRGDHCGGSCTSKLIMIEHFPRNRAL
jgi:hypothetical protein